MSRVTTITSDDFRTHLDDYLNRAQHAGDRVLIARDGRGIAAVISENLELLLALEDRADGAAAEEALRESEDSEVIVWDQIR